MAELAIQFPTFIRYISRRIAGRGKGGKGITSNLTRDVNRRVRYNVSLPGAFARTR